MGSRRARCLVRGSATGGNGTAVGAFSASGWVRQVWLGRD
jgi:hypothetical protein